MSTDCEVCVYDLCSVLAMANVGLSHPGFMIRAAQEPAGTVDLPASNALKPYRNQGY